MEAPSEIGTRPPKVFIHYNGLARSKASLERALDETGAFGSRVATLEEADVVLTVREGYASEISAGILLNAIFLYVLPLPAEYEKLTLDGSWQAGELEPFYLPGAKRTIHSWAGIPLLLFSFFITADRTDEYEEMGSELAQQAHAGYAAYVKRAFDDTRGGDLEKLAKFVDAFPGPKGEAELLAKLEGKLWKAIEQGGTADDYFAYIERYTGSLRAEQARKSGRNLVWEEVSRSTDLELLGRYARTFPEGDIGGRWGRRVDEVAWTRAVESRWVGDYRTYLELLPQGPNAERAKDALAWAEAEELGTIEAFNGYIDSWPSGEYQRDARRSLALYNDPTLPESRAELARWVRELKRERQTVISTTVYSNQGFRSVLFEDASQTRGTAQLGDKHFELRNGVWSSRLSRRFLQKRPVEPEE